MGDAVATVVFPPIGIRNFGAELPKGGNASLAEAADDQRYFPVSVLVQLGNSDGVLVEARGDAAAKPIVAAALETMGWLSEREMPWVRWRTDRGRFRLGHVGS